MTSIQLDDVSKVYADGVAAVRHVDLAIDDGEFRVLLGPSGCGKSTLLRMLAGLEAATDGDIRLDGRRVNGVGPRDRDVAMAFQQHALYPHMTVAENLGFPLKMSGMHATVIAERVEEVARALAVDDVLDRHPNLISGGQQQRVSLGRSIIRSPRLFLMDEPLSNLDAHSRIDARTHLRDLQRRLGTTTVFVTHDQAEAMALADRITVMRDGVAVQTATPTELYTHPIDVFVARFVGSPPMNVFAAVMVRDGDRFALRLGSQTVPLDMPAPTDRGLWTSNIGRRIAVGIRPESLQRVRSGGLVTSVASTEPLGHEQLVHAALQATTVELTSAGIELHPSRESAIAACVAAHDDIDPWEPFIVRLDSRSIHLFDLDTGRTLDS